MDCRIKGTAWPGPVELHHTALNDHQVGAGGRTSPVQGRTVLHPGIKLEFPNKPVGSFLQEPSASCGWSSDSRKARNLHALTFARDVLKGLYSRSIHQPTSARSIRRRGENVWWSHKKADVISGNGRG